MAPRLLVWDLFTLSIALVLGISRCQDRSSSSSFTPGQTIVTAGASAISNGSFSLGFVPRGEFFQLGIWYSADPEQFLLWSAGGAGASRSGAILQLDGRDGSLALRNAGSSAIIWTSGAGGAASGQFQDTGNLVLANGTGQIMWSSFGDPKNTLLPGQFLRASGPSNLTSSSGNYTLSMDRSGNLTLRWGQISYWSSDTDGNGNSSSVPTNAVIDVNGVLNLNASSTVRQFFPEDYGPGSLRRLTLEDDGNLRFFTLLLGSGWIARWQAVIDQCQVYSYCGNYGICSHAVAASAVRRAVCNCPAGLAFVDPRNPSQGCSGTGDVGRDCATQNNRLVASNATAWLDSGVTATSNSNREQCLSLCGGDSSCFGCVLPNDGSGRCIQFRSVSMSGYSSPSIQSTAFLKVCSNAANSPPTAVGGVEETSRSSSSSSSRWAAVGIAVVVTIAAVALVELAAVWAVYRRRHSRRIESAARDAILDYASGAPIRFTYKELQNATYNFDTKIGEGGFGAVYKGSMPLPVSRTAIAVKKLEGVFQGEREFRTEVATIGSTHHMNLMRLVGFCAEGSDARLLVYEFMPNGSLDRFLFHHEHDRQQQRQDQAPMPQQEGNISYGSDASASPFASGASILEGETPVLDWPMRFKIALGTARALAYLHEECREAIVHCDFKPENILLDDSFAPKVSDFGLARLIDENNARSLTTVRGTRGYLAPEWLANMPITIKSDVYSYGVVLLELVGGRRNFDACREVPRDRRRYAAFAYRALEAGRLEEAVDERMHRTEVDAAQLERVVKAAFWCLQDSASARPSMSKVVQILEGNLAVLHPPLSKAVMDSSLTSSSSGGSSLVSSAVQSITGR